MFREKENGVMIGVSNSWVAYRNGCKLFQVLYSIKLDPGPFKLHSKTLFSKVVCSSILTFLIVLEDKHN